MRIEKRSYSSGAWRLIGEDGNDVHAPTVLDHPTMGKSVVSMPVCADTKQGVVDRVLGMLAKYAKNDCSEIVRWIRPEDSMPDADITVLVNTTDESCPVWPAYWNGEEWMWNEEGRSFLAADHQVIAWAEMPEGPKQ
jgi:hypothetical protein